MNTMLLTSRIAATFAAVLGLASCRVAPVQVVSQPRINVQEAPAEIPRVPEPDAAAAVVPPGYAVEVVATGLTYPTSIEFDEGGGFFVAEAGYSYGDPAAPARILHVSADGQIAEVANQLSGPVTDLLWHQGGLYVSHRGKVSLLRAGQPLQDLITGLPSKGDHHNNQLAVGPDGKIYLGQGTATNSGIVGVDSFAMGWLQLHPDFHDRPARDIALTGVSFVSMNPLMLGTEEKPPLAHTGAFQPFSESGADTVPGTTKANGTVLRFNADGSELEVFAWGLRNPFGVAWGADQQLYVAENGFDERGSRPIPNAPDSIWLIRQNAWYGFPDYAGGEPVTAPKFQNNHGRELKFLMANHPPVEQPLIRLPSHVGVTKIEVGREPFGYAGHLFVGQFGDMIPMTANDPEQQGGYKVIVVDPRTRRTETFFHARETTLGEGPMRFVSTPGPKRILDVRLSPAGDALYVVDYGAMAVLPTAVPTILPFPQTGVIWRITREGARLSGPTGISFKAGAQPSGSNGR